MQAVVNAYLLTGKVASLHDRCRRFMTRMVTQYHRFLDRLLERNTEDDEIQSTSTVRYRGNRSLPRGASSKKVIPYKNL